ncbi:wall-associated receptor kinase 2-like [Tripterygium wilfordii]|uniref:wall-associated receptor kinase 2-like n=1 Tax=Tripterygium wilfordii TaxID=458696 RepID=UPI0018F83050|nr:wall-associated receptor kinase 2-like [Tripterygium wilfordii]
MVELEKMLLWLVLLCISQATKADMADSYVTKAGCSGKCGNVSVPYPFGIGEASCAINNHFFMNCSDINLFFGTNMPINTISVEEGTVSVNIQAAFNCFNATGLIQWFNQSITLGAGPYRFSDTENKLTVFGCDTFALMGDADGNFSSGCLTLCSDAPTMEQEKTCSGVGCCQTPIPHNLKTLDIIVGSLSDHKDVMDFNPCGYAFVADQRTFNASDYGLSNYSDAIVRPDAVIEWVVSEETCEEAEANSSTYACGRNTNCTYSENGRGYRCLCKEGFRGNPYFPDGCRDIDECKEPEIYTCKGSCKNTIGNYTCHCPVGMRGDGKVGCQGFRITTIFTVIGATIVLVIISVLVFVIFKRRRKEKNFLDNGGKLLKHQRVRIFSEAELLKATNNYDKSRFLGEGGFGSVYRGILADNIEVAVKKPKGVDKAQVNEESQQEISIVSQVNHKNVVKLLGLCLETKVPLLVYEFISNGTLHQHIHDKKSRILKTWKPRLRIAEETALALNYLHSLAYPPIIHSDVKSMNILLDDNYTAKVSDFGASVLISADETVIATKIQGTFGYLDPEYLMTGNLTAKSDVYSFGIVILELLTGEKPSSNSRSSEKGNIIQHFISSLENNTLHQILDFEVSDEDEMDEIEVVAELVKRCIHSSGVKRPTMKEVAEELSRLRKLGEDMSAQQNGEETEHLLGEPSYSPPSTVTANVSQPDTYTIKTFNIEGYADSI